MRIERTDVSSIVFFGLITGYAPNIASFSSHQSAYILTMDAKHFRSLNLFQLLVETILVTFWTAVNLVLLFICKLAEVFHVEFCVDLLYSTIFLLQMFEQYIAPSMKISDIVVPWGKFFNICVYIIFRFFIKYEERERGLKSKFPPKSWMGFSLILLS